VLKHQLWHNFPVYVYTPKNSSVQALKLVSGDFTSQQKTDSKNYWLTVYNNRIVFEAEATLKYNCHAFAWISVTEPFDQDTEVCIIAPHHNVFWTDNSYIEVTNPSIATHVSFGGPCSVYYPLLNDYINCDHSARTTSTLNYFSSKWGPSPRFRHHKDDCPYSTQDLHYYARLKINGPDLVPCSGNITFSTTPTPTSITWSASGLNIVSPQNNQNSYTVQKNPSYTSQSAQVSATYVYNGKTYYLYKSLDVGIPRVKKIDANPGTSVSSGTTVYFTAFPALTSTQGSYEWYVTPSTGVYISPYGQYCNITFGSSGYYTVGARTYSSTSNGHSCNQLYECIRNC